MEIFEVKRQLHQPAYSKPVSRTPSPVPAAAPPDSPPPSPPVPTSPVAPTAPEPPPGPRLLHPCGICGRTFLPESLPKHSRICEKMAAKKRKTFDSSRQRREGTDLAQFLPKNFGLPENSPFIEKSPPPSSKPAPKKKDTVRSVITKTTAELSKCPHCGRGFGVRAFERHVDWCADKAKILPTTPANPSAQVAQARHRLAVRTQYKAPLARGRRSLTREKSDSRSASVESRGDRGLSPQAQPPREGGDYRQPRVRASESMSSMEDSPHVPVIRGNKRGAGAAGGGGGGGGGGTAGDAARARHARLARDLSSNSNKLQDHITVRESKTDPCVSKKEHVDKDKIRISSNKQLQLNKLEKIALKHSKHKKDDIKVIEKRLIEEGKNMEDQKKYDTKIKEDPSNKEAAEIIGITNNEEIVKIQNKQFLDEKIMKDIPKDIKKSIKRNSGKSQIPQRTTSKGNSGKVVKTMQLNSFSNVSNNLNEEIELVSTDQSVTKIKSMKWSTSTAKVKDTETKLNTDVIKATKDSTSICPRIKSVKMKRQTEIKKANTISLDSLENDDNTSATVHSIGINTEILLCPCVPCVIHDNGDQKRLSPKSNKKTSQKICHDQAATEDVQELYYDSKESIEVLYTNPSTISSSVVQLESLNFDDDNDFLPPSISALEIADSMDDMNCDDEIQCEGGIDILATDQISCETYTKNSTFNPTCFDEFMDLTDKMMIENEPNANDLDRNSEEFVFDLHTPNTESLENIDSEILIPENTITSNENDSKLKRDSNFNDSIFELKSQLKEILIVPASQHEDEDDDSRNVCEMEHITIYELQTLDPENDSISANPEPKQAEDLLPSINENNKVINNEVNFNKKKIQKSRKSQSNFNMLRDLKKSNKEFKTFIVGSGACETNSDVQSVSSEAPPLKLPRIEGPRIDDDYDPFLSAARQMKELMSSDTNIPKKILSTPKDPSKTLPYIRSHKEKSPPLNFRPDNSKTIKDAMNKNTQRTPALQRMKSFGSSNSDYTSGNTFGGRSSSFRVTRNDKKSSPKLNTTFTKCSNENLNTIDKSQFNRTSSLNRSFSSYSNNYGFTKSKEKPVSMSSSMYNSFQRTVNPPSRLEKIDKIPVKKEFVNLDSILADDNSSTSDSHYIDPRLINKNDNLPITVNTILNNPDIISSMESLLNTENLPAKFESFKVQDNKYQNDNNAPNPLVMSKVIENKTKSTSNSLTPSVTDLSAQYDKIMTSLEQSIASKVSVRDDDSLCEDFDLEEFMTSFDEELHKQKSNKRSYSSTTRVVKTSDRFNSNGTSEFNSISSSPKVTDTNGNGLIPFNKSNSMTFSNNNIPENIFPSSVKRSASLLDSFQKKSTSQKTESYQKSKSRVYKEEETRLEQDIMQSLKEFDKFYESEKMEDWISSKESHSYSRRMSNETDTVKRETCVKPEKKPKPVDEQRTHVNNHHNHNTHNGKASNDSAYSSLNRISPSKLSVCNPKEAVCPEGAGSDSGASHKGDELRAVSSDEFLALERSTETLPRQHSSMDKIDGEKFAASSGRRTPSSRSWRSERRAELSSSSESIPAPPPPPRAAALAATSAPSAARLSRFCHECGSKFPVDSAKFCIECGVKRLAV